MEDDSTKGLKDNIIKRAGTANEVAKAIYRRIHAPGTTDMLELANSKLKLVGLKCEENCPVICLRFILIHIN